MYETQENSTYTDILDDLTPESQSFPLPSLKRNGPDRNSVHQYYLTGMTTEEFPDW